MADKKITDFPEISSIGVDDVFLVGGTNATYKAKLAAVKTSLASVTGIKGDAENSYRTGQVNITPENIGAMTRSIEGIGVASDSAEAANDLQTKIYSIPAYTAIPIRMYYSGSSDSTFTNGTTYVGLLYNLDESGGFWTSSLTNNLGEMVLASRSGSSANVSFKRII